MREGEEEEEGQEVLWAKCSKAITFVAAKAYTTPSAIPPTTWLG